MADGIPSRARYRVLLGPRVLEPNPTFVPAEWADEVRLQHGRVVESAA